MSDGTLRLSERSSVPATPEVNTWGVYATSDGIYSIDDAGTSIVLAASSDYVVADYSSGWIPAPGTWVGSSDTITITTSAGSTDIYGIGDKLRWKQGGGFKYNYAIAFTDTTLTITGSTDYEMTTDTITDNYYSHQTNPVGFPQWFNWVPVFTGFSINPVVSVSRFSIIGRTVIYNHSLTSVGTSNAAGYTISVPVKAANNGGYSAIMYAQNNGTTVVGAQVYTSTTVLTLTLAGYGAWATGNGKGANFSISYEI